MAVSTWDARAHGLTDGKTSSGWVVLLWLVGLATAVGLAWRRRFPVHVTVLTALVPLVLPLDPTPAMIALGSLIVRRFDRITALLGGLVGGVTLLSVWRDGRGTNRVTSFWHGIIHNSKDPVPVVEPLSIWAVLAITAVCLGLMFGIAMIVRDREQRRVRVAEQSVQRTAVESLSDEVARRAERERLAQEVHDALGHRLSLLSLHAGALELAAGEDRRAAESAALVRANAQQSMDDLRSLLTMLRQPDTPDVAAPVPCLHDVDRLIDETALTGVTLISTVTLTDIDQLDPTTSRSAYRITQELLTNARRHAPGIGVRVRVVARPDLGVEVEVANHLLPEALGAVTPGGGLRGIRSRVEQLDGQWHCWVDEHRVFRAAARLPWVPLPPAAGPFVGPREDGP